MTNTCSICLEPTRSWVGPKIVLLSCSHVFHRKCIAMVKTVNKTKRCPNCRSPIFEDTVIQKLFQTQLSEQTIVNLFKNNKLDTVQCYALIRANPGDFDPLLKTMIKWCDFTDVLYTYIRDYDVVKQIIKYKINWHQTFENKCLIDIVLANNDTRIIDLFIEHCPPSLLKMYEFPIYVS